MPGASVTAAIGVAADVEGDWTGTLPAAHKHLYCCFVCVYACQVCFTDIIRAEPRILCRAPADCVLEDSLACVSSASLSSSSVSSITYVQRVGERQLAKLFKPSVAGVLAGCSWGVVGEGGAMVGDCHASIRLRCSS